MNDKVALLILATIVVSGDKLQAFPANPTAEAAMALLIAMALTFATLALNPDRLRMAVGSKPAQAPKRPRRTQAVPK